MNDKYLESNVNHHILFERYRSGDMKALDSLYKEVEKLVYKMVQAAIKGNEYHPLYETYLAVAQDAVLRAAAKYDINRGSAWPPFVRWNIRTAINHENRRQASIRAEAIPVVSVEEINTEGGEKSDWFAIEEPSNMEEDMELEQSTQDFIRSQNLDFEQAHVVWGLLRGDTYEEIGVDINRSENYISVMNTAQIRPKFEQYLLERGKIYKKAEELELV